MRLFELKPDAVAASRPGSLTSWLTLTVGSAACLHGKTFAVDRHRFFVGPFNIDRRSIRLNTEMGPVIESPALAAAISRTLDEQLAKHA